MSKDSLIRSELEAIRQTAIFKGSKFNGNKQLVETTSDGKLPALDGSLITGITSTPASINYIAQDNISIYDIVTSDGKKANSNTLAHRNKIIGISNITTLIGFLGTVIGSGATITNPSWTWTIGDRIYLNGISLSTIPSTTGFLQYIGTATVADTIEVNISESIRL